ncbi:unnamed protein product, partial [Prorocentrum cordatum]
PNVMPAFSSLRRIMGWASHCGVSLRTTCFWNRGNRDPPRPPLGLPTFAERAAWGILQVRAFDQRDNNGIKKHTNLGRFARSSRICAVPPSAAR